MDASANLSFLPWVRQGAAGAIATVDTLGSEPAGGRRRVGGAQREHRARCRPCRCGFAVRRTSSASTATRSSAPIPVRTPATSSRTAFPSIEFDRADFPWLFTPARANTNGQLRPWLCLVVVRQQDGVQLMSVPDAPLPQLRIADAGQAVPRAARPEGLLGVGARPGRRRQHGRSERRRRGVERRTAPLALAPGLPATADAEHRLPRLCRADVRRSDAKPVSGRRLPTRS